LRVTKEKATQEHKSYFNDIYKSNLVNKRRVRADNQNKQTNKNKTKNKQTKNLKF
jgi:hypothetical protein